MSSTYQYTISDPNATTFTQQWSVGNHKLKAEFLWSIVTQEQSDILERNIRAASQSDPLQTATFGYNRDYDYVTYYTSLSGVDLTAWLGTNPDLPVSIINKSQAQQITIIEDRIATCTSLASLRAQFREAMRWQITITETVDGVNVVTVTVLEPGAWFRYQDNNWAIRYTSTLDYIGKGDLGTATIEFEVFDE